MCTALVYRDLSTQTFGLGFNRDESFLRKPSLMPSLYSVENLQILSPKDGDHGGTWIGVNSHGEVFAILNFYEAKIRSIATPISRGLLLKELLERKKKFFDLNINLLSSYHPFRLLFVQLEKTWLLTWNGENVVCEEDNSVYKVYASSAIIGSRAEEIRSNTFKENFLNQEKNFFTKASAFLSCHIPKKGIESPCMHRDIAHTVSQSIIELNPQKVNFWYKNTQPCESEKFYFYEFYF